MYNLTLIAAVGKNGELGKNNELIWNIPEDMQFFKKYTTGKYIVMGMNTLKSLPRLLSDRKYIVLTREEVKLDPNIIVFHNKMDLLNYVKTLNEEVVVIGGAQIFSLLIEYVNKMLLTEIDASGCADVYFPDFDRKDWNKEILSEHVYQNIHYKHLMYTKK